MGLITQNMAVEKGSNIGALTSQILFSKAIKVHYFIEIGWCVEFQNTIIAHQINRTALYKIIYH